MINAIKALKEHSALGTCDYPIYTQKVFPLFINFLCSEKGKV